MSSRRTSNKEITHSASMRVFDVNGYKLMLYDIYDELSAKKFRSHWLTITWSLISTGIAGLFEWLINDVLTQTSLQNYQWLCIKSCIYGSISSLGLLSFLIYLGTRDKTYASEKKKFVEKYYNYDKQSIISHSFMISSKPAKTTAQTGIPLNNDETQTPA